MRIQLETDSKDHVKGATFGITPGDFKKGEKYHFSFPPIADVRIHGFQVDARGTS